MHLGMQRGQGWNKSFFESREPIASTLLLHHDEIPNHMGISRAISEAICDKAFSSILVFHQGKAVFPGCRPSPSRPYCGG